MKVYDTGPRTIGFHIWRPSRPSSKSTQYRWKVFWNTAWPTEDDKKKEKQESKHKRCVFKKPVCPSIKHWSILQSNFSRKKGVACDSSDFLVNWKSSLSDLLSQNETRC